MFDGAFPEMHSPVLVASADGVGTKLKIAFATGIHNTIGRDLVNHCVNDILVQGARPLFFLDYIATGKLALETVAGIVEGIAKGCRENGCALLGGETHVERTDGDAILPSCACVMKDLSGGISKRPCDQIGRVRASLVPKGNIVSRGSEMTVRPKQLNHLRDAPLLTIHWTVRRT